VPPDSRTARGTPSPSFLAAWPPISVIATEVSDRNSDLRARRLGARRRQSS
jgi:hypothetical protein